jgi:hypothetical protein
MGSAMEGEEAPHVSGARVCASTAGDEAGAALDAGSHTTAPRVVVSAGGDGSEAACPDRDSSSRDFAIGATMRLAIPKRRAGDFVHGDRV